MQYRIHTIIALLLSLSLTACNPDNAKKANEPEQEKKDGPPQQCQPRYQIVFSPNVRADTFLLDTYTGKIWCPSKFTYLNGEPTIWDEQEIIDSTGKIGESKEFYVRAYGFKKR